MIGWYKSHGNHVTKTLELCPTSWFSLSIFVNSDLFFTNWSDLHYLGMLDYMHPYRPSHLQEVNHPAAFLDHLLENFSFHLYHLQGKKTYIQLAIKLHLNSIQRNKILAVFSKKNLFFTKTSVSIGTVKYWSWRGLRGRVLKLIVYG